MDSELITLLEREAQAEREKILSEARAQAEEIRAEAQRDAEALVAEARERLAAEAKAALVRAQSTAQLRASSLVLQAKEEAIGRVFASAEAELADIPGDGQRYPVILRTFIEECLTGVGGKAVIIVHPTDQAIAEAAARERGNAVTIRTDPSIRGGVRISSPDARFVVTNTLASRLERARPMLASEVAKILWE